MEVEPIFDDRLLRKFDWHILPRLSILYLLCYVDRTYNRIEPRSDIKNIGNAKFGKSFKNIYIMVLVCTVSSSSQRPPSKVTKLQPRYPNSVKTMAPRISDIHDEKIILLSPPKLYVPPSL